MDLQVLKRAPSQALISLSETKLRLGESGEDLDEILTLYIARASGEISDFIRRQPARQLYRETVQIEPGVLDLPPLRQFPVESVELFEVDGVTADYVIVDRAAGLLSIRSNSAPNFSHFPSNDWAPFSTFSMRGGSAWREAVVEYWAGYALRVASWSSDASYSPGDWVRPAGGHLFLFEVEVGGNSGADEPDWSSAQNPGDVVLDGGVRWVARDTPEVPSTLVDVAFQAVKTALDRGVLTEGVASESEDGYSATFRPISGALLTPDLRELLEDYR